MPDNRKTILVTGAGGQLGSCLRLLTPASGDSYVFTGAGDGLSAGTGRLDITDADAVMGAVRGNKADVIINCAAYTGVDRAEDDRYAADAINRRGAENLAAAAKETGATLIHISTDYVFSGEKNTPYTEEDAVGPASVYGATKLAGEEAVVGSGCKCLIFRTSWLYSEFGNNFVKTILRLTAERDSIDVVFDQAGTPTYAGDLAEALFFIVENSLYEGNDGIYHYSGEGVCSWYDFAREITALAGQTECRIGPCRSWQFPTKAQRPAYSVLDKAKFKMTFGIEVPYWRDSLARAMEKLCRR